MTDEIPEGLGERGARLWVSLMEQDPDMSDPMRELALECCRVADVLERYNAECEDAELSVVNEKGNILTNPLFAERRQQQQNLKQLVAALRLPDETTGKRPQRRGPRGAYTASGKGNASVSSLMRARAASGS